MAHHKEFAVKLDKISPISDFMIYSLPTEISHIILKNAKKNIAYLLFLTLDPHVIKKIHIIIIILHSKYITVKKYEYNITLHCTL